MKNDNSCKKYGDDDIYYTLSPLNKTVYYSVYIGNTKVFFGSISTLLGEFFMNDHNGLAYHYKKAHKICQDYIEVLKKEYN